MSEPTHIDNIETPTKQDVSEAARRVQRGESASLNPTGKGGFGDHPENRSNGSWKKEETPRGRLEKLLNATSRKEFLEQLEDNKINLTQNMGNVVDSALLREVFIIDQDHPDEVRVDFDRAIKLYEFIYGRKTDNDLNVHGEEGIPIIKGFVIPTLPPEMLAEIDKE